MMDQQLEDVIIEQVDGKAKIEMIKEILRFEKAKLGHSHRRGKTETIRNAVYVYLKKKGEIL